MTICRLQIYFPKDPPPPTPPCYYMICGTPYTSIDPCFFQLRLRRNISLILSRKCYEEIKTENVSQTSYAQSKQLIWKEHFSSFLLAWSRSQHQLWVCINPSTKQKILSSIGLDVACCAKGRNICGMETQWDKSVEPATSENPTNSAKRRYFFFLRCSLAMAEGIWDI